MKSLEVATVDPSADVDLVSDSVSSGGVSPDRTSSVERARSSKPFARGLLLRKGGWGLADQALISAVNFFTMVLLARALGPSAFGVYVLVYTGLQFANGMQNALIVQPHNVLAAARHGGDYVAFTVTSTLVQLLFAFTVAALVLLLATVTRSWSWSVAPLLFALAPAAAAWQMQEFARRVLYTELRLSAAFANNLISYGSQAIGIWLLWYQNALTGPRALLVIAATSGIACLVGLLQIRRSLAGRPQWNLLSEMWHFGRWLGGAELGYWFSSQAYLWLSGGLLGAAAAGMLKAAYTIFGPTRVFGFALRSMLPTWFSRTLAGGGGAALHQQLKLVYLFAVPALGCYCLLVAVFARPLLQILYGDAYVDSAKVLALYSAVAFSAFLACIVNAALRAQQRTRVVFFAQLAASFTLPIGWMCIRGFGVEGAVIGMMVSSLTVNSVFWWAYLRHVVPSTPPTPAATSFDS